MIFFNRKLQSIFLLILVGISGFLLLQLFLTQADRWNVRQEAQEDPYTYVLEINSVEDYLAFSRSVAEGNEYEGQYVNLNADLDFSGVSDEAVMIGYRAGTAHVFSGIFDGNGHRLSNLTVKQDNFAGLFSCLKGTVCNLMLCSSFFSGQMAGAAAASSLPGSYVLNCYLDAEVEGTTYNTVVGNNEAMVYIYSGLDHVRDADYLNQRLLGLDDSYGVKRWLLWETVDDQALLSQNAAVRVTDLSARTTIAGRTVSLQAYYSWPTYTWTFALPAGYEDASLDITLILSDGTSERCTTTAAAGPVSISVDQRECGIQFLFADAAPTMMIRTQSEDALSFLHADRENYLMGSYMLLDANGAISSEGNLNEITGHGNDSWLENKKSYNLELTNETDLLNIGASQKYTLLCGYRNNSLPTYKIVNDFAREVGIGYAPGSSFVHLYIDGSYMGMYLLCGKMEIGENRFNIQDLHAQNVLSNALKLKNYEQKEWQSDTTKAYRTWYNLPHEPEDITGGYLLELDDSDYDPLKSRFVTDRGTSVVLKSTPYASENEVNYIAEFWQDFEDALYSETGYNEKGHYYTDYIDLESFADQWLFYELDMESCLVKSIYYYKDSDLYGDGKLHAAQPWDLETHLLNESDAQLDWIDRYFDSTLHWTHFYKHADFAKAVAREWQEKFVPALEKTLSSAMTDCEDGLGTLDWYGAEYAADFDLETSRWHTQNPAEQIEKIRNIYSQRLEYLTSRLAEEN